MSEEGKNKRIKEQFDRHVLDSKVATVGRIRDLLLSDEFLEVFAKRFLEKVTWTPFPTSQDQVKAIYHTSEVSE